MEKIIIFAFTFYNDQIQDWKVSLAFTFYDDQIQLWKGIISSPFISICNYRVSQKKVCFRNFQQPNLTGCSGNHFPEAADKFMCFFLTVFF